MHTGIRIIHNRVTTKDKYEAHWKKDNNNNNNSENKARNLE